MVWRRDLFMAVGWILAGGLIWTASAQNEPRREFPPSAEIDVGVIDPGHGGNETGTVSPTGIMEKDVTLSIARLLKHLLESRLGLQVMLTREDDRTVDLDTRTAMANNLHADLFISIHANAAMRGRATGAETYYLSTDWLDEETRKRLSASEPGAFAPRGSSHPSDPLALILWDMAQIAYLEESSRLAQTIQQTLNQELGLPDRGVKQAPFRVLMGAQMPAVLVEVGFLDNPEEARRLADGKYQTRLAEALYRSIERYLLTRSALRDPSP
jgi:N-acetylmuramoyl-L-alanine amidase